MTDITERLRRLYVQHGTDYVQEAADEIERLRAEVSDLQAEMDGEIQSAKVHIDAYLESNERLRAEIERLRTELAGLKDGWLRVIDTELVITHTGIAEFDDDYITAKTKLLRLIDWYVSMRTDPVMNGGWQLVPMKPTEHMVAAMEKQWMCGANIDMAKREYMAALAAAPKPEDV